MPGAWREPNAIIDGVRTKLQVAHFKLSHSRAFLVRAYLLQTHEMLFDAHNHAFRVLGGVPRAPRSAHPSLPHPGNRKRQLPL